MSSRTAGNLKIKCRSLPPKVVPPSMWCWASRAAVGTLQSASVCEEARLETKRIAPRLVTRPVDSARLRHVCTWHVPEGRRSKAISCSQFRVPGNCFGAPDAMAGCWQMTHFTDSPSLFMSEHGVYSRALWLPRGEGECTEAFKRAAIAVNGIGQTLSCHGHGACVFRLLYSPHFLPKQFTFSVK